MTSHDQKRAADSMRLINYRPDDRFVVDEPEDQPQLQNYAVGYAVAAVIIILAGIGAWTVITPLFR